MGAVIEKSTFLSAVGTLEADVNLIIHTLANHRGPGVRPLPGDLIETILLMIQALGVSLNSINVLARNSDMGVRDIFSITRSVFEISNNISYICICGEPAINSARIHAYQKLWRDHHRSVNVAGLRMTLKDNAKIDLSEFPELREALSSYTSKSGKEVTSWAKKSVDQIIEEISSIDKNVAHALAASRILIYRHSSEIMHGTFYGVYYFWTATAAEEINRELAYSAMRTHYLTCLGSLLFSVEALVRALQYTLGPLAELDPIHDRVISAANLIRSEIVGIDDESNRAAATNGEA